MRCSCKGVVYDPPKPVVLQYIEGTHSIAHTPTPRYNDIRPVFYLEKARMTFAEMWRKKMDPMNATERTRTTNGSLRAC